MIFKKATRQQRRPLGFWEYLRNPKVLRIILMIGWYLYRLIYWILKVICPNLDSR